MKRCSLLTLWILILVLMITVPAAVSASDEKGKESSKSRMFSYKPPVKGAPGNRIGGGTRGPGDDLPEVYVLVPEKHTGLTTQSQPTLYWYLSKPTTKSVEFTLNNEKAGKTLVQKNLGPPRGQGVQRLNLSDLNVKLSPGASYQWFVSLLVDPDQPSKNVYAGGTIQRVEPSKNLQDRLNKAGKEEVPAIYAEEGIWYDALASLSGLINANPQNKDLKEQRAFLLEQVGLTGIAEGK